MKIATAGSRTSRKWKTQEMYWEQLLDRLRTPARTGETMREYAAMSRDEKTAKKDVGGFVGGALTGGRRVAGAVTERWLVTLDADFAEPGDWESFTALYDMRCCVYSTHSHTPEHPKLRWIIPLKRAVSPEEYVAIARKVAEWIGIERMDPLTYQPERLMFWPSCCQDADYFFREQDGPTLDGADVLREYGEEDEWREAWRWPTSSREGEMVQRESRHQADPLGKTGIVGAFCRAYTIYDAIEKFDLPYVRCAGMSDRYTYTLGSTAAGAVIYGDGRWLYSNHATDPAGGHLCNAFDLVRVHKFGDLDADARTTEATRLPSYLRMVELAAGDELVRRVQIEAQMESAAADFADMGETVDGSKNAPTTDKTDTYRADLAVPPPENAGDSPDLDLSSSSPDEDDDAWKNELTTDKKTGAIEPTLNNACIILSRAPAFRDRLSFCEMGEQIYVTRPMPWRRKIKRHDPEAERRMMGEGWTVNTRAAAAGGFVPEEYHGPPRMNGRVWDEQDRIELYKTFERLGWTVNQKRNGALDNALINAAQEHTCDPIRDYLCSLEWDGIERLDELFIYWLGAEDCELNRVVTRLWMMGAVDRVMRPGCQFDSVLVFCGEQGIGKTSMLRTLAGEYFTNAVDATSMEKSTAELLQGKWIVELGELDSVKKSSATAFKNFISSTSDHYRKAYATDAESHPRQCVFAGTTNESSFLRDDTGERRYWIMPCAGQEGMAEVGKKGTLPGFADVVDQVWAEAVVRWRERMAEKRRGNEPLGSVNAYLYLTDPALEREMEQRRAGFKLVDTVREDIEEYLDRGRPDNWEQMSAEAREDFFRGVWIGDPATCNYQIESVTLKEIRTELYHERPEDAARSGRSSFVYRVTSVMDSLPGWERTGTAQGKQSVYGGKSVRWSRVRSSALRKS